MEPLNLSNSDWAIGRQWQQTRDLWAQQKAAADQATSQPTPTRPRIPNSQPSRPRIPVDEWQRQARLDADKPSWAHHRSNGPWDRTSSVSPSTAKATSTPGVGPRSTGPAPVTGKPIAAPKPAPKAPGARPISGGAVGGIGGQVALSLGAQLLYPVADRALGSVAQSSGRAIGEMTGIKDSPEEFAEKPGWYKRWACFNAATSGVNDPRCEDAPPPPSNADTSGSGPVTYAEPPITGGQLPGVSYRVFWQAFNPPFGPYTSELLAGVLVGPIGYRVSANGLNDCSSFPGTTAHNYEYYSQSNGQTLSTGSGCFYSDPVRGVRVERVDGLPDTGGNLPTEPITAPYERPSRRNPTPPSGDFNPAPLPPTPAQVPSRAPAAPAPVPELEPVNPEPNRPPDRKAAPIPSVAPQPSIAPDGSPTGNPAPDATINNVPQGGTTTLPNGTTVTKTAGGVEISVPLTAPRPLTSPDRTINPGETATEEEKPGGLPWWLAAPPVVGKIPSGSKVSAPDPSTFTDPDPPKVPPPSQPPTDNPCRCNAPIMNKIDALDNKLNQALGGAGLAADGGILAYLQRMQAFAEKAWKATQMQKVLDVLTFVGVMHNVSMLSRDVGETMGYVLSQALDIVGIDDEEGNALDVSSIVGNSVTNFLRAVLGDVWFEGIRDSYRKANRIVQSASMVIWTIRSIQDSSLDLMEWVAESTGKIGNALKRFGVVGERAYPWMSERAKAQHRMRARFDKLTNTLENAEDVASSFAIGTSNVLEIQQETGELGENWQRFKESLNDEPDPWFSNQPVETQVATETSASVSPAIVAADAERSN